MRTTRAGRLGRGVRIVLSVVCWTLAVLLGLFTAAAFAGGGVLCQQGEAHACAPQTWQLVAGIVLTLGFGAAAALLWQPKPKERPRRMWDYRQ